MDPNSSHQNNGAGPSSPPAPPEYIPTVTIILEASITKAAILGNTEVTPLHVIDRIIDCDSSSILCRACLRCKALKLCISQAIHCIPVISQDCIPVVRPSQPALSNDLVKAIVNGIKGGQVCDMDDVKQLFVYLLDDPTVQTAMERAGFSISVIKNNMENFGTAFRCV